MLCYRKMIGAEDVLIFTDVKKKHSSHSFSSDVDIVETVKSAEFFLSDSVIWIPTFPDKSGQAVGMTNK